MSGERSLRFIMPVDDFDTPNLLEVDQLSFEERR